MTFLLLANIVPSLPETMSTQALFSIGPEQPGNRHSDPHEAATSVLTDATAAVPEPQVKMEVSEGLSWPLYISYCKS